MGRHTFVFDQSRDTPGEHARLPRSRAGQDQQRPRAMLDRFPLRGIQPRQQVTTYIH